MASITANGFCAVAALSRYTSGMPWMVCFRTGKSCRTFRTSKPAAISLLTVLMEFLEKDPLQRVFERSDGSSGDRAHGDVFFLKRLEHANVGQAARAASPQGNTYFDIVVRDEH